MPWSCATPDGVATLNCLEDIFRNLLHIVIRLGGVIAFVMVLIGGFRYLTAGEDPKKAQAARNTITYAVIGLVLFILVWFLFFFIETFTGVKVTEFRIGP
jgi:hypothetical protein